MSEIVGIDLGTTNSLIGLMDSGFPVLIADKEGVVAEVFEGHVDLLMLALRVKLRPEVGRAFLPAAGFQPASLVAVVDKSRLKRRLQARIAYPTLSD